MRSKPITKEVKIKKHKYRIEIYPALVDWEIFPHDTTRLCMHLATKKNLIK